MTDWLSELIYLHASREKGLITDKHFKIAEKNLAPPSLIGVPFLGPITYKIDDVTTGCLVLCSEVGSDFYGTTEPGLEIKVGNPRSDNDKDFEFWGQGLFLSRSAVEGAVHALRRGKKPIDQKVISGCTDLRRETDYVVQSSSEWDKKLGEPTGLVSLNTVGNAWRGHTPVPLSALTTAAEILQLFPNP